MTNKSKIAKAGLGLLAGVVMFAGVTVSAMTMSQAQALVASLGITGAQATALVTALTTENSTTTTTSGFTFKNALMLGSKSSDVMELQKFLNSDSATMVAMTGAGSKGMETMTFGPATKAAVIKYQMKHNISPASGRVGPLTMASINASNTGTTTGTGTGTGTNTGTGTQTGPVTVMLSSDTPASGNIIQGQATADLAHFTFSGNGTVTAVAFQLKGIVASTDISNVYLYDGVTRVADSATVNTNGAITFSGLNMMVSGSKNLAVKIDYSSATSSTAGTVGVALSSFTSNGTVSTVNVMGNLMYVVGAPSNMTAVNLHNPTDVTSTVNAGTTAKTVFQEALQVSGRAAWLKAATFRYVGSASNDAIANVKLVIDGTVVGAPTTVNSSGYIVFDLSGAPYNLTTNDHNMEVRADIVKGSARNFYVSLQNAADLMVTDSQLGVNVAATVSGSTFSAITAGTITVREGSIASSIDSTFSGMTNVTGGATNAVIAKYKLHGYGEDVKVQSVNITTTLTGGAASGLANVTLFFNGSQVGSSYTMSGTSDTHTFQLGSSMIVPAGVDSTLEVHADIQSSANVAYSSGSVNVSGTIAANQTQGLSSLTNAAAVTLSQTTGLSMQTGQLVVAKNTAYTNQTFAPNAAGLKIASFTLQNQSSSESVRVTNLALSLTATSGTSLTATTSTGGPELSDITNVKTSETSGSGANAQNASASLNYSVDFTIAPGSSKTIDVFADLGSTTGVQFNVKLLPTAYGAGSNVTLTPGSSTTAQVISIATGTVSAPSFVASNSTAAQYIATAGASATDIVKNEFQVTATNGTAIVNDLRFAVKASSTGAVSTIHVGNVTSSVITPSATGLTGTHTASTTTITASSTSNISVGTILTVDSEDMLVTAVPSSTTFTVVRQVNGTASSTHSGGAAVTPSGLATLNGVNISVPNGTSGTYIDAYASYTPANGQTGAIASGATSTVYLTYVKSTIGSTVSDAATATPVASNQMTTVGSKPTVAVTTGGNAGLILGATAQKIGEITVSADTAGSIKLNQVTFTVGTSNIATSTISNVYLADGSTVITTSDCIVSATTTSGGTVTCELASNQVNNTSDVTTLSASAVHTDGNGYLIPGSGSKVFSLYAQIGTAAVSGTTPTVSTSVTSAGFNWDDVAGNGTNLTGTSLYNFPTNSYSFHS